MNHRAFATKTRCLPALIPLCRALTLLLVLLIPTLGPQARAATEGLFEYTDNGESITITRFNGTSGHVVIPSHITGKPVTVIGGQAFSAATRIWTVTFPNTLLSIGPRAFEACTLLPSIVIPDSVRLIDEFAFFGCFGIRTVSLGGGVRTIANNAFLRCERLSAISIPDSVTSLGVAAFGGCDALSSITIGSGLTFIPGNAFYGCTISTLELPDNITSILSGAFSYCRWLERIRLPESVTFIDDQAFAGCSALQGIVLGESIRSLGASAFEFCTSLKTVVIGSGLTTLGPRAFANCPELLGIAFLGNPPALGQNPFLVDPFYGASRCVILRSASRNGWPSTFGGRPVYIDTADQDADGVANLPELLAWTDLTSPSSYLKFEPAPRPADLDTDDQWTLPPGFHAIYFQTVPGRTYEISTAPSVNGPWTLARTLSATTTQKRAVFENPAASEFYRLFVIPRPVQ